ncbi:unnamed protein product, partial [Prorocentrum cordatum]
DSEAKRRRISGKQQGAGQQSGQPADGQGNAGTDAAAAPQELGKRKKRGGAGTAAESGGGKTAAAAAAEEEKAKKKADKEKQKAERERQKAEKERQKAEEAAKKAQDPVEREKMAVASAKKTLFQYSQLVQQARQIIASTEAGGLWASFKADEDLIALKQKMDELPAKVMDNSLLSKCTMTELTKIKSVVGEKHWEAALLAVNGMGQALNSIQGNLKVLMASFELKQQRAASEKVAQAAEA